LVLLGAVIINRAPCKWLVSLLLFVPGIAYAQHGGGVLTLALGFLSFLVGFVAGAIANWNAHRRLKMYIVLCALWASAYFILGCAMVAGMPSFGERLFEVLVLNLGTGMLVFSAGYGVAFTAVAALRGRP